MTCQQQKTKEPLKIFWHFEPTKLNVIAYQSYDDNYKLSFKKKKVVSSKFVKISENIWRDHHTID